MLTSQFSSLSIQVSVLPGQLFSLPVHFSVLPSQPVLSLPAHVSVLLGQFSLFPVHINYTRQSGLDESVLVLIASLSRDPMVCGAAGGPTRNVCRVS